MGILHFFDHYKIFICAILSYKLLFPKKKNMEFGFLSLSFKFEMVTVVYEMLVTQAPKSLNHMSLNKIWETWPCDPQLRVTYLLITLKM